LRCQICEGGSLERFRYRLYDERSLLRRVGYSLPDSLLRLLAAVPRLRRAALAVATNRRYFDIDCLWCNSCGTGCTDPPLGKGELAQYYEEYYWENRHVVEGQHRSSDGRPHPKQIELTADRLAWIDARCSQFETVIDYGAGDCAAGYLLRQRATVTAVDPSAQSAQAARDYGLSHSVSLDSVSPADLLYSSHSIEHVHSLSAVFSALCDKVNPGGHLFFETPNIADRSLFPRFFAPPHTYTLSIDTFEELVRRHRLEMIAWEAVGPPWSKHHQNVDSDAFADLRVLLRRV